MSCTPTGGLVFVDGRALWQGKPLPLRPKEIRLLAYFDSHRGQVLDELTIYDAMMPRIGPRPKQWIIQAQQGVYHVRKILTKCAVPLNINNVPGKGYVCTISIAQHTTDVHSGPRQNNS